MPLSTSAYVLPLPIKLACVAVHLPFSLIVRRLCPVCVVVRWFGLLSHQDVYYTPYYRCLATLLFLLGILSSSLINSRNVIYPFLVTHSLPPKLMSISQHTHHQPPVLMEHYPLYLHRRHRSV